METGGEGHFMAPGGLASAAGRNLGRELSSPRPFLVGSSLERVWQGLGEAGDYGPFLTFPGQAFILDLRAGCAPAQPQGQAFHPTSSVALQEAARSMEDPLLRADILVL